MSGAATQTRLGGWLRGQPERAHKNTAVVALANKLARIAWAVLARGRSYEAAAAAARRKTENGQGERNWSPGSGRSVGGGDKDGLTVDRRHGSLAH